MASRTFRGLGRSASLMALLLFFTFHVGVSAQTSAAALAMVSPPATMFHFTDGGEDIPGRMTTDTAGNFYVAAQLDDIFHTSGFAVLKYKFSGTLQGTFRYKPAAGEFNGVAREVKLDKLGNIYAVGDTSLGGLVVSFTSTGAQRWARHFSTSGIALAVDASGNVYTVGTHVTGNFQGEWVVVKFTSAGQVVWTKRHTGTAGGDVRLTDIQLDPGGNPVVLGTTDIPLGAVTNTMTTLKLDVNGNILFAKDFVAVAGVGQIPGGLAMDSAGNIYVTCTTHPPEGNQIPFTVKYDASGNPKFVLSGTGAGGAAVAVDPSGDILLTGSKILQGVPAIITASKVHANGVKVCVANVAAGQKIVPDATGNVFVAGDILNADTTNVGPSDYLITKLSPSGALLFQSRISAGDEVTDAVVDPFGNVLVTGDVLNASFEHDILTVRTK